jgi:hypothetical protein
MAPGTPSSKERDREQSNAGRTKRKSQDANQTKNKADAPVDDTIAGEGSPGLSIDGGGGHA